MTSKAPLKPEDDDNTLSKTQTAIDFIPNTDKQKQQNPKINFHNKGQPMISESDKFTIDTGHEKL